MCDIGGQDIKVLFMQNGDIKNFRVSNQCSAGNGMLSQAMADRFGIPVHVYGSQGHPDACWDSPRVAWLDPCPVVGLKRWWEACQHKPEERLARQLADMDNGSAKAAPVA